LELAVTFQGKPVIAPSPLVLTFDGVDLTAGPRLVGTSPYQIDETYPVRGVHARAVDRCNGWRLSFRHSSSGTPFTLEMRAFNDGVAYRLIVPGDGQRVPYEASTFTLPAGSVVWYHSFRGHYEGKHVRKAIADVQSGEWAAPPLTFKLPDSAGYASVTEANLVNYPGMGLQADGQRGLRVVLGHKQPVSYPFELRFKKDIERLSKPAAITGPIVTPWRVVLVGADLNSLVNSDILTSLCPPPDKTLFPQGLATDWIEPGPAVWNYLDGGDKSLEGAKEFCRLAGELGFKHNVIEGYWRRWSDEQLKELVAYGRQCGVSIWAWSSSKPLREPEVRRALFQRCRAVGIRGVKLDFFDHEAMEVIDYYQTLLRETAEAHLMVNFHGSNKPTGQSRTWPHELTREAVSGMEGLRNNPVKVVHDVTLPFTRLLAGPADYTPVHFGRPGNNTSWAHEVATAAIFTSPLLTYAANPATILKNPAAEMMKSIPSVWDETIVLPPSEIGELAVYARRRSRSWFLAVLNGPTARTIQVPLTFLGEGKMRALLVRDQRDEARSVQLEEQLVERCESLTIELRAGGGFIGRFTTASEPRP
jgi:alpha-glucosidase